MLDYYKDCLQRLPEEQKNDLQRRIGLKVLEIEAQFEEMTKEDVEGDDH